MEKTFTEKVREIVRKIPKGQIMTYKQVAEAAGSSRAARAVGTIMRNNTEPGLPCHRVIRSDGKVAGSFECIQKRSQELHKEELES